MKFVSVFVVALLASVVQAFAPVAFTRGVFQTQLLAGEPEGEEGGLDLDLGEMFKM